MDSWNQSNCFDSLPPLSIFFFWHKTSSSGFVFYDLPAASLINIVSAFETRRKLYLLEEREEGEGGALWKWNRRNKIDSSSLSSFAKWAASLAANKFYLGKALGLLPNCEQGRFLSVSLSQLKTFRRTLF